jgi:hypothetical protein
MTTNKIIFGEKFKNLTKQAVPISSTSAHPLFTSFNFKNLGQYTGCPRTASPHVPTAKEAPR